MLLSQLFENQKALEAQIIAASGIEDEQIGKATGTDLRFLALHVKLSELANLTKCYKYGINLNYMDMQKVSVRYIEVLQYLLSIGIHCEYEHIQPEELPGLMPMGVHELASQFLDLIGAIENLRVLAFSADYFAARVVYARVFALVNRLGETLGITPEVLLNQYYARSQAKDGTSLQIAQDI